MAAREQSADTLMERYVAAVREKDVDGVLALYAEDVRVFDLFDRWSYDGRDAWRGALEAWFASMGDTHVRVVFDDVRSLGAEDLLTVTALIGYQEFEGVEADSGPTNSMPNRLSWTLQHRGGTWLIVHEHTSVPIDGGTFKGMFER